MSADVDASGTRGGTDRPVAAAEAVSRDARVLAAVLRRLLRGEAVSPASPDPETGLTRAEAGAALARLEAAGALHMADGAVRAAYPLSGVPTRHRLNLRGTTAYANCAMDALAVPFMVDEPVGIESECAECGRPVVVQMRGDRVLAAEPAAPVVLYVGPRDCCEAGPAVLTRCPYINFFCGEEHAVRWRTAHPQRPGSVFQVAEAIGQARERFDVVIRLVRDGDISPAVFSRYVQWLTSRRDSQWRRDDRRSADSPGSPHLSS
jgi:hypothetical protein